MRYYPEVLNFVRQIEGAANIVERLLGSTKRWGYGTLPCYLSLSVLSPVACIHVERLHSFFVGERVGPYCTGVSSEWDALNKNKYNRFRNLM